MFKKLFETRTGRIIMSIVWGLGLAALFQRVCTGKNCIVIKAPHPKDIKDRVFQFNKKCYTYTPYNVSCQKSGNIPISS